MPPPGILLLLRPLTPEPGAGFMERRSARNSGLGAEDRTENLCVALEETVLGSGAHTDCVPGRLGLGRLGRPTWVRVVSRAFPRCGPRDSASWRTVATWSRTFYACLSLSFSG